MDMSESLCCDTPTNKDSLGFKPYVEAIAEFLIHKDTEAPITLSIEGQWGCGKSSFMKQLKEEIEKRNESKEKRKKYFTVWFNSWRYENEDELWAAFALSLMDQLSEQLSPLHLLLAQFKLRCLRLGFKWKGKNSIYLIIPSFISAFYVFFVYSVPKIREILSSNPNMMSYSVAGSLFGVFLTFTGVLVTINPTLRIVKDIKDAVVNPFDFSKFVSNPDYTEHISFIENFHTDFGKIIKSYAENSRVYVFVDDLDRCEIPKAAELMQAINLMISDEANIYFCIGMDRRVISAGIASKHESSLKYLTNSGLEYGYEFIEKFIQLPFKVPIPKNDNFKEFITPLHEMRSSSKTSKTYSNLLNKLLNKLKLPRSSQLYEDKNVQSEHNEDIGPDEKIYEGVIKKKSNEEKKILNYHDCSGSPENLKNIIEMVASALDRNPRRIKQFLNLFRFQRTIGLKTGLFSYTEGTDRNQMWNCKKLAKFVAINIKWPSIVSALNSNTRLLEQLQEYALKPEKEYKKTEEEYKNFGVWVKDENLITLLREGCVEKGNISELIAEYSLSNLDFDNLLQISPVIKPIKPLNNLAENELVDWVVREKSNLKGANLKGANLVEVNLKGANLEEANLGEANLKGANLEEANLKKAYLLRANLWGGNLENANLGEAILALANLTKANLAGANLWVALLAQANLARANLTGTNLTGANIGQAILEEANLARADLKSAHLEGANLRMAILVDANLEMANLIGAQHLSLDQLSKVKTLYNAKLDEELLIPLKEKYPALFEKPDKDGS